MASRTIPPRPRLPLFKSGKPGLAELSCEETRETTALLGILALGNREIEAGRVKPVVNVVRRLRARKIKARRRR
jgi:hypothetical protein